VEKQYVPEQLGDSDIRALLVKIFERLDELEKQFEDHSEMVQKKLEFLVEDSTTAKW
jgi:hypothetical protein